MTFNPEKPDSGKSPILDCPTIQTNFSQFQAVFSKNHTALNSQNQGKHESVIFSLQSTDPGVTTDITSWYAKNAVAATAGPQPQLFVQIPKFLPVPQVQIDIPNAGMQITYNQVNTSGPQYQSFLPGGYLLYTGSFSGVAAGSPPITINTTITLSPIPTKILMSIATSNTSIIGASSPNIVSTNILTSKTFNVNAVVKVGAYTFSWFCIAQA